jgi:hypothetical protein
MTATIHTAKQSTTCSTCPLKQNMGTPQIKGILLHCRNCYNIFARLFLGLGHIYFCIMLYQIHSNSVGYPSRVKNFHIVQTSSWAHPSSYPMGTEGILPQEQNGRGMKLTIHLQLVSRRHGSIYKHPPTPQYVFMVYCLIKLCTETTLPSPCYNYTVG